MLNQYTETTTSNKKYIYLATAGVIIIALLSVGYLFLKQKPVTCGDKICQKTETCYSCFEDCKCLTGEYCSQDVKTCVRSVCGNGICEITEDADNCCKDCGCYIPGEVCDFSLNKCEKSAMGMTNEQAEQLIRQYYGERGLQVSSIDSMVEVAWNNELVKIAIVTFADREGYVSVIVKANSEVIEAPHHETLV